MIVIVGGATYVICGALLSVWALVSSPWNPVWIEPVQLRRIFLSRVMKSLETSLTALDSNWSRLLGLRFMPCSISGSSIAMSRERT